MKKRNILIVFVGIILIIIVCLTSFNLKKIKKDKVQIIEKIDVTADQNKNEKQGNTYEVNSNNLIGIWHEEPYMPSGWADHYHFFEDGTYRLDYDEMDGEKRVYSISGTWTIENNELLLEKKKQKVLEGGELVEAMGSTATDYEIEGGELIDKEISPPVLERHQLSYITDPEEGYPSIEISGQTFWKMRENPNED